MFEAAKQAKSNGPAHRCLTYCPLPYNGQGPAQSCVSVLENFPRNILQTTLVLPRATRTIGNSVLVEQTLPSLLRYLPWRIISKLGHSTLENNFSVAIDDATPENSIAYFWPTPSLSLVKRAHDRGILTLREMTNTFRGTAKAILDRAYSQLDLEPAHGITLESVECEREELALYDYVFASNPFVETSLVEAGVKPRRILRSSFGWSSTRFFVEQENALAKNGLRFLFVGTVCVGKGVPQLLAAWKNGGVKGELLLVGRVEEAIKPLLSSYLEDNSVRFLDFIPDIGPIYRSADVFVFPTLTEGGPQVTYEAAACSLPILTSPMGAGRLIQNGINGLVVEPDDVDGFANALKQLATSRELRDRLARQANIDAREFTYEKIGRERAFVLKGLIDQKKTVSD